MKFCDLSCEIPPRKFNPHPDVPMHEVLNDPNPNPNTPSDVPNLRTYAVGDIQAADLANRFTYHTPKPDQQPRYVAMREKFRELAEFILAHTPPCREQSHALTLLDDASFNANAAIARRE